MKYLEDLPEIAEHGLAQVRADDQMKYRILHAAREAAQQRRVPRLRAIASAACVLAVITAAVLVPMISAHAPSERLITTIAAGDSSAAPTGTPAVAAKNGIGGGSVSGSTASGASLWERGPNSSGALVSIDGRWYQMLSEPAELSGGMLGSKLGTVTEFTDEPALSSGANVSNVCAAGTEIYAISGMNGALAAGKVDGVTRVFQRVSFNGISIRGKESLADTLGISGRVSAVTLQGAGTVTDSETVSELVSLLKGATFDSASRISGGKSVTFTLDSGLAVQLTAKNGKVSACGTWSCPDFMDALTAALN